MATEVEREIAVSSSAIVQVLRRYRLASLKIFDAAVDCNSLASRLTAAGHDPADH